MTKNTQSLKDCKVSIRGKKVGPVFFSFITIGNERLLLIELSDKEPKLVPHYPSPPLCFCLRLQFDTFSATAIYRCRMSKFEFEIKSKCLHVRRAENLRF